MFATTFGLLALLQLSLAPLSTYAAHSRRRVVVRSTGESQARYDRSITTFSPEGRLLQVEYGMEAASRGESIIGIRHPISGTLFVLLLRSRETDTLKLEPGPGAVSSKVHRIDDHLFLFTAGLSGDARALAANLRATCQQHRLSYSEPITLAEAAQELARLQHGLTKTGGARPLGCSAILAGVDSAGGKIDPGLYCSDPGGIVDDCLFCTAGQERGRLLDTLSHQYTTLIGKYDLKETISTLLLVAKKIYPSSSKDDRKTAIADIWVIEPHAKGRGKLKARCFSNVESDKACAAIAGRIERS